MWDWLYRIFAALNAPEPKADKGFIVKDGVLGRVELKWSRQRLPIDVVVHPNAADYQDELMSVVRGINNGLGIKVLAFPCPAADSMVQAFAMPDSHARIHGTILVCGDGLYSTGKAHLGDSDFRFDTRTGEILNVRVTMPPRADIAGILDQQWIYQALLHEVGGHGLGLAHDEDPTSIMWPTLRNDATMLLSGDIARLRKAYGP